MGVVIAAEMDTVLKAIVMLSEQTKRIEEALVRIESKLNKADSTTCHAE